MAGIWRYKKRRFQKQRDFSGTRLQRVTIAAGRIMHVNGKRFHDMGTSTATTNQRQDKQQMVPTQGLQHAIPEVCTIACLHEEGICMGNTLTADIARQEIHEFGAVETTTTIRWFRAQKFDIPKFLTSLAQIMDQKINKINCFILTGESNSGKSIVARSILDAFKQEEVGEVYQGVQNNFMWQGCIGKRAILVEEVMMSSLSVESWKLMMQGTRPVMVAVKNSANQRLDPTPMIITCNALPWASCTIAKSL